MISSLVFSHGTNSKFLISIASPGSGDGDVCLIWNVETGAHEIATSSVTSCIAASPDGKHFACATSQTLTLLAIKTKRVVKTLLAVSRIMAIAFSHDGAAIACGTERGTVQVWHLLDRALICNVGLALMQVELAPYVALDVIDFLLADGNNLCESFETHTASYHMEKISSINALQRHVKKFAMQL
jgi:WD40 repeat protein